MGPSHKHRRFRSHTNVPRSEIIKAFVILRNISKVPEKIGVIVSPNSLTSIQKLSCNPIITLITPGRRDAYLKNWKSNVSQTKPLETAAKHESRSSWHRGSLDGGMLAVLLAPSPPAAAPGPVGQATGQQRGLLGEGDERGSAQADHQQQEGRPQVRRGQPDAAAAPCRRLRGGGRRRRAPRPGGRHRGQPVLQDAALQQPHAHQLGLLHQRRPAWQRCVRTKDLLHAVRQ